MSMRRLELLQWLGLLAGAGLWGVAHIVGYGITEANCGRGSSGWGIDLDLWESLVTGIAGSLVILSAVSAAAVVFETRETSYEAAPPVGRLRFFAIAALVADVLFLAMIVLYAVGTIVNVPCRQA
jgi:hypothetical protein